VSAQFDCRNQPHLHACGLAILVALSLSDSGLLLPNP
jgi:hypothetical protein